MAISIPTLNNYTQQLGGANTYNQSLSRLIGASVEPTYEFGQAGILGINAQTAQAQQQYHMALGNLNAQTAAQLAQLGLSAQDIQGQIGLTQQQQQLLSGTTIPTYQQTFANQLANAQAQQAAQQQGFNYSQYQQAGQAGGAGQLGTTGFRQGVNQAQYQQGVTQSADTRNIANMNLGYNQQMAQYGYQQNALTQQLAQQQRSLQSNAISGNLASLQNQYQGEQLGTGLYSQLAASQGQIANLGQSTIASYQQALAPYAAELYQNGTNSAPPATGGNANQTGHFVIAGR
jgi:hypothetical protein